jgi:hypothetical protein
MLIIKPFQHTVNIILKIKKITAKPGEHRIAAYPQFYNRAQKLGTD